MTEQEADQVAGYIFAAFPVQAEKVSDLTWTLWRDILTRFPLPVGMAAAKQFLEGGPSFIPQPGEIAVMADRIWQAAVERDQAERKDEERRLGWRQIEDRTQERMGRVCLAAITRMLAGRTGEGLSADPVAELEALGRAYPAEVSQAMIDQARGWHEEKRRLRAQVVARYRAQGDATRERRDAYEPTKFRQSD